MDQQEYDQIKKDCLEHTRQIFEKRGPQFIVEMCVERAIAKTFEKWFESHYEHLVLEQWDKYMQQVRDHFTPPGPPPTPIVPSSAHVAKWKLYVGVTDAIESAERQMLKDDED
jgi:hypothetical protein